MITSVLSAKHPKQRQVCPVLQPLKIRRPKFKKLSINHYFSCQKNWSIFLLLLSFMFYPVSKEIIRINRKGNYHPKARGKRNHKTNKASKRTTLFHYILGLHKWNAYFPYSIVITKGHSERSNTNRKKNKKNKKVRNKKAAHAFSHQRPSNKACYTHMLVN